MLGGKIIRDGWRYCVKVGNVNVDITEDVRELIEHLRDDHARDIAELRAKYNDINDRYEQIAHIVLAGGRGMPTGQP